ncbi:hypothetical protein ONS95_010457 [Cadophora gregata]|uniref:uncharacterized protein n=1 Tax=Cadophora gregata TaxID=51156 RepID=UPI0026DADC15|nr:uncharacterized protein ONS95_010457 [Cadophora gregata]KAK0122200.1 hypothetical protein ONS95_010457 [Cadophora gregata]KAK0127680.1 hypothetical protein ONS96_007199 [Cadophora gregata f. sp. sojae]
MFTSPSGSCNGPSSPCSTFIDPRLSTLRAFHPARLVLSATATDAIELREQTFKAFNYRIPKSPVPELDMHYEDHLTASSRQPKQLSAPVVEQPQPQPQQLTMEVEFLKWIIIFITMLFTLWCLGLMVSSMDSEVTLVVTVMISSFIVDWMRNWLKKEEEFEL